ncbi:MAG: hypothetical protein Tsb009_29320 [Planctomycetaceae bacterium]
MNTSFPPGVADQLKFYVYRLIDPRNGETFYVGKGKDNRVFAHIHDEKKLDGDPEDNKLKRIHEIRNAGFEVAHVIHRHGMNEATAIQVEAALIDAYPGLTNIMGGQESGDFGVMHAEEIIKRYCAEPAVFEHKLVLISVNKSKLEKSLYNAVRFAWKISIKRAMKADYVLATSQGIIVGAYIADEWLEATEENFPGLWDERAEGRFGFVGREAPEDISKMYVGKRVPDKFRKRGASNPIKYSWK